ncbi:MAG: phosphoenolpyruvate synthase [Candidatus Pacearchaeota archaeon]
MSGKRDDAAVKTLINRILDEHFSQKKEKKLEKEKKNLFEEKKDIKKLKGNKMEEKKSDKLMERNILWLNEIGKEDINIAGGKGANLAEMYNIGLPVPPAFIITANAFKKFIEDTGLKDRILNELKKIDIENTSYLEQKASEIQLMITRQKIPQHLEEEIIEAYNNMNVDSSILKAASSDVLNIIKTAREPIFVAVRSSATTEDLKTASFAGQQETFLNIKGTAQLIEAVKKCWASLFTARAIYYRERRGFEHEKSLIAVIVQKMINSDKSGVTFTINPVTNNKDEIVIEAVFGLGEGIVSGAIAPDRYIVDKHTNKIKEKFVSFKPIYFTRSSSGNTVKSNLPMEKINEQVLENYEIIKLANYARDIEEHYGIPQDIEWAIEYGKIYIVQTRPVTTVEKEIKKVDISGKIILDGLAASPGIATGRVRLIGTLADLSKLIPGEILVTKMTNPDMVVAMQKSAAIVTDEGGQTCHAAIVSREVGLPAVVGTRKATKVLQNGQLITVDAYNGKIYEGKVEIQKEEKAIETKEELKVSEEVEMPSETVEEFLEEEKIEAERKIPKVYMNLGEPNKIYDYKNLPFDGIGLMRLEFVIAYQIRRHPLFLIELGQEDRYEEGIAKGISIVAKEVYPKPVIVRFSDFKTNEYRGLEGGNKYEEEENNPMIGFRGVSRYISREFEPAFRLECKAIKKAREKLDNIHVMLPFVRTVEEVKKCLKIMKEEDLIRNNTFKIWLMAEVPSIALIPEEFAQLDIDGVSIGSNDLTQLILGVDRDSALLGRMGYFNERNPAVLKAIQNIIKGFHKYGKTVSICGQAPSVHSEIVEFLVKEGIDSISVNPDAVEKVKEHINKLSLNN